MKVSSIFSVKGARFILEENGGLTEILNAIKRIDVPDDRRWGPAKKTFQLALAEKSWVTEAAIDKELNIKITAFKKRTAVAFQTGNIARAFYDILKLGGLYGADEIDAGALVTPVRDLLGDGNESNFERVSREAEFLMRPHPMPLLILGIGP